MSPEKTELCLEVLSAIAWADADLTVDEIARAVDLLEPMDYSPRHRIEEIFMMPHHLPPPSRLLILAPDERLRLILDAYCVAKSFRGVVPEEMAVLHKLHSALSNYGRAT